MILKSSSSFLNQEKPMKNPLTFNRSIWRVMKMLHPILDSCRIELTNKEEVHHKDFKEANQPEVKISMGSNPV